MLLRSSACLRIPVLQQIYGVSEVNCQNFEVFFIYLHKLPLLIPHPYPHGQILDGGSKLPQDRFFQNISKSTHFEGKSFEQK